MRNTFLLFSLLGLAFLTLGGVVLADAEFQEAMQETEDQWQAVRSTMQQGKTKFDDFRNKYQEYEDAVFSQNPEKGIQLAKKLFNLSDSQTAAAKEKVNQLREMFNTLDKNGLKDKLKSVSEKLDLADKVAGEVENVWQFAKKFDPEHAKDNPTYGLRLIGSLLKDGAGKLEKIPLIGQILGKWLAAYGEIAGDFANALDRLGKKISEFRGGSLCGQHGYLQDQQAAFKAVASGQDCLTFFACGVFPRMRGETYEGNDSYFLFDPSSRKGYLAPKSQAMKVYRWHERLLERRALDPDWLASRANSLKPETEAQAREYYRLFSGWKDKSDPGWLIIDELGLYQDAYFYGRLDEETFVANYIVSDTHHNAIEAIIKEYKKYVLVSGMVYEEVDNESRRSNGAAVEFTVGGKVYKATTEADGKYEILMEAKEGDAIGEKVTKEDFDSINQQGRIPQKVTTGLDYTLRQESVEVVVSGKVSFKKDKDSTAVPLAGASVSASAPQATSLGSATSGGDGSYSLTVQVETGVEVTCTATKDGQSGAASATATSATLTGMDILITATAADSAADSTGKGPEWIINVTVHNNAGQPLDGAVVTGTGGFGSGTTAGGTVSLGPVNVPANWEEEPFSVTITPSMVVSGGGKVGGTAQTVTYAGTSPTAVTVVVPIETAQAVTISGKVTDANGVSVDGAVVIAGALSATVGAGGTFSLGPHMLFKDSTVTVNATLTEGTNSFAAAPVTVTFDGANKTISGVTLVMQIESEVDVTISGRVQGLSGKAVPGVAISTTAGAAATTDGAGSYTLPAFKHILGKPVTISAAITVDGTPVAGSATCTPMQATATAPVITLDLTMEEAFQVTISGNVMDDQGAGVDGATVTSGSASSTTSGGGTFLLGPVEMVKNETASLSATYNDGQTQYSGGPVTTTFDGVNTNIGGIVITVTSAVPSSVTISGSVVSAAGVPIGGASISSSSGHSDVTGGAGTYSLGPIEYQPGQSITVNASVIDAAGKAVSGSATVMPTSETEGGVVITVDVEEFSDDDLDSLIDELEDDLDSLANVANLKAEFDLVVLELDGLAAEFSGNADFFMQRLRELMEAACESKEVSYALSQARANKQAYTSRLDALYGVYAQLTAAATAEDAALVAGADGEFSRVVNQETTIEARYMQMLAQYGVYKCDEDKSETESDDEAQDTDPDDIASQTPEECGNGIDDDGDGLIDECEDGCCDKNVQVTVDDCGAAADDIFGVSIDGKYAGVTPKGTLNTFNRELEPGWHTVTVSCLDDGGDPLGSDIGTACVNVVIYGQNAPIGGGALQIPYGGSAQISFEVLEEQQVGKLNPYDGSAHNAAGLESD